jgi:ankyrin repeat protein
MTTLIAFSVVVPLLAAAAAQSSPREKLFAAIHESKLDEVKKQLERDPSLVSARSAKGTSTVTAALFISSGEGFLPPRKNRVLAELLARGAPLDRFEAAALGDTARISKELAADPKYVEAENSFGWAPLHFAAFAGNIEAAKLLLDRGAAIDRRANTKFRNTPLQVSLLTRQDEMAAFLVSRGADVRVEQAEGFTALHEAAQNGSEKTVKLLLDAGADPNVRSTDGRTPLGIARKKGYATIARLLESRGAREAH